MSMTVHSRIRVLLEETNDAFYSCGRNGNADFAEFATLALSEFKHILHNPKLTSAELQGLLRKGMSKHKDKDPNRWSVFMAQHVAREANQNRSRSALSKFWGRGSAQMPQDNQQEKP